MFNIDSTVKFILLSSALAWFISQAVKFLANCYREGKLDWYLLFFGQGGMPSSHTAFVTTLALGLLIKEGLTSVTLVASAYAIITIRDALGVRYEVGSHAKALNAMAIDQTFEESVGHTFIEVIAGVLVAVTAITITSLI